MYGLTEILKPPVLLIASYVVSDFVIATAVAKSLVVASSTVRSVCTSIAKPLDLVLQVIAFGCLGRSIVRFLELLP